MINNCCLFSYYKVFGEKKCIKNYVINIDGVFINVNLYVKSTQLLTMFKAKQEKIVNYTYESLRDFYDGKIGLNDLVVETYHQFKTRNGL